MKKVPAHPSIEDLAAFVRGNLSEDARVVVEQHITECNTCCEALENVADDTWVGRMREAETLFDGKPIRSNEDLTQAFENHPRYRLIEKLGEGGMGEVYLAEHRLMERQVALKLIRAELVNNTSAAERFRQEVRTAARLSHRGIVTAFDAEEIGGFHFLVMEYVDGTTLDEVVARRGRQPVMHACNYIRQAAIALHHAHQQGMVHRDVKPQNLMLSRQPRGVVKILDFGLTRIVDRADIPTDGGEVNQASQLTQAGAMMGTPDYVAPEQVQDSHQADIRSDIYSLGCTFYFLLAGRSPFSGGTVAEKLSDQLHRDPTPLEQIRDDIPNDVLAILSRMMEKQPTARFQTPADVAAELAPFAKPNTETVVESADDRRKTAGRRSFPWKLSRRTLGILIACIAAALFAVVLPGRTLRVLYVLPAAHLCHEDFGPVRDILTENDVVISVTSSRREIACDEEPGLTADFLLEDVQPHEFDAIVFAGGSVGDLVHGDGADRLSTIVRAFNEQHKPVAAISIGLQVLEATSGAEGRRMATYGDTVIVDDKLITTADPVYADDFAAQLLKALKP